MTSKEYQKYTTLRAAVDILAGQCASTSTHIIEALTGSLWNEEEAGIIGSMGQYDKDEWFELIIQENAEQNARLL